MKKELFVFIFLIFGYPSFSQTDSLIKELAKTKSDSRKVKIITELGMIYTRDGKFEKAIENFNKALVLVKTRGNSAIEASLYNEIGNVEADLGNNSSAFNEYNKALKVTPDTALALKGKIYKNIGALYLSWKNLDKALENYDIALKYAQRAGDKKTIADCFNNKGTVYEQQLKYPEAIKVYNKALNFYKAEKINERISITYNNLAIVSKETKQLDKAANYYKEAVKYAELAKNTWITAAIANNLGNLLSEMGDTKLSETYLNKSLTLSKEINAKELIFEVLSNLSTNEKRKGDYKAAYNYNIKAVTAKDEFINEENTKEVSRLQEKYESVNKEKKIAVLSKENTDQKLAISRRNTTIITIVATFIIASILSLLLYNRYILKQEAKLQAEIMRQQEIAVKGIIEAEEKERNRIAGDLHDGLGQLFSAIKMNLSGLEGQLDFRNEQSQANYGKTMLLVDESCREIRSISHQMVPGIILRAGLVSAIRNFITKIDEHHLKISLEVEGLKTRLESNTETVLFRIIQETVNNVIKHAGASQLDIQIVNDQDGLSVMIEDNGRGFDLRKVNESEGMGLKNMETRVRYLKGSVDIDSAEGRGTLVNIWIPLERQA